MTETESEDKTKIFTFSFPTCTNKDIQFNLTVPITFPFEGSTKEFVQRLINMFHIPVYLEEELDEKFSYFVEEETRSLNNATDAALIDALKSSKIDCEGVVRRWERLYRDHTSEYAERRGATDEEVFAAAYHRLVHSAALDTILQVENSYASTVRQTLASRDEDMEALTQRQTDEMEEKMRQLGCGATEDEINDLAARHFNEQSLATGRWGSQVDALYQAQRAQYRSWLMQCVERGAHDDKHAHTPSDSPLATFSTGLAAGLEEGGSGEGEREGAAAGVLDESFTIHLGSQLKQTFNVRICVAPQHHNPDSAWEVSRRLQTALGLYSSELAALVVLWEGGGGGAWPRAPPAAAPLLRRTAASTDYHFPPLDDQLQAIQQLLQPHVEQRNEQRQREQAGGCAEAGVGAAGRRRGAGGRADAGLRIGDTFLTRHSNLPDVHLLFHMLVDDATARSHRGEINSRHPAILGLRNILKAACTNDVTTLSLPVLLRHDITEEMTVSWCVRRAELVLKCVKGFMIEMSSWGGAELKNINFLVPEGVSEAVFSALAALLPTIFRMSVPLRFKCATA